MHIIDKLRNYRLKYREKFSNSYYRQLIRLIRMLYKGPLKSINAGVIKTMINLTYRCQCNCDYCWCGSYEKKSDREISFLEIKLIIDQIAQYPSLFTLVSFIGGEPLLREDICHLISHAAKKGLFTEMETNGFLLSEINVSKIKKAGLNHIFVRIEGSDKKKHDSISRINGCFEHAIEGIKNCVKENLSCSIFMNATREKIIKGEPDKIINLAKKLKVNSVRIIYPTLSGRWLKEENQRLSFEEETQVQKLLDPDFVYLESSYSCTKNSIRTCPAFQRKFFHISCYGEVQLCPFVPISFGNLRIMSLNKILNIMWKHPIFKADYTGCPMNNANFRNLYILPAQLESSYKNIIL